MEIPLVDLTLDTSDDDEYELSIERQTSPYDYHTEIKNENERIQANTESTTKIQPPSSLNDPVLITSSFHIINETVDASSGLVNMDGEMNLGVQTTRQRSATCVNLEGNIIESFYGYEEEPQMLPNIQLAPLSPPLLSPQLPQQAPNVISISVVDNEQPGTSSSFRNDPIIMPDLKEFFNEEPITSPVVGSIHQNNNTLINSKNKNKGDPYSKEQMNALRSAFNKNSTPTVLETIELLSVTGLEKVQIQRWFSSTRKAMERHEKMKEQKRTPNKRQSDPNSQATNAFRVSWGESADNDPPNPPKVHRHSEPTHCSRVNNNINNPIIIGATETEKIEYRMDSMKNFSITSIKKVLQMHEERVLGLVMLYMKPRLDMKKCLLKETRRLKEMSSKISPFSGNQRQFMKNWIERYFQLLMGKQNEENKMKLRCAQMQVVEVWLPVIVYGKLQERSLECAIKDFTYSSAGRMVSRGSIEYSIPGILRGIKNLLE